MKKKLLQPLPADVEKYPFLTSVNIEGMEAKINEPTKMNADEFACFVWVCINQARENINQKNIEEIV